MMQLKVLPKRDNNKKHFHAHSAITCLVNHGEQGFVENFICFVERVKVNSSCESKKPSLNIKENDEHNNYVSVGIRVTFDNYLLIECHIKFD